MASPRSQPVTSPKKLCDKGEKWGLLTKGIASETSLVSRHETDPVGSYGAGQLTVEQQQPWVSGGNSSATPSTITAEKLMNQMTVDRPRYLVVKRKDGTDFSTVSPFNIHKELYSIAEEVKDVRNINEGLLVETISKQQLILSSSLFGGFEVAVVPDSQLNLSKGVVYCRDLLNFTIE